MEHPFLDVEDISEMKMDEIQSKITELLKRINFANRTGNSHQVAQLQMLLDSYNAGLRVHVEREYPKSDSHTDKIDIT